QSMSFYDSNQTGQLMSRVTNDVSQVQFFLTQGIARLVNTIATVAIYMVVLIALDLQLTLVTLIVAPAIWLLQSQLKRAMPLMRQTQRWMADLDGARGRPVGWPARPTGRDHARTEHQAVNIRSASTTSASPR